MASVKRIYNIVESFVKLMGWQVERLDVQAYHIGKCIDGFCGYLYTKENGISAFVPTVRLTKLIIIESY